MPSAGRCHDTGRSARSIANRASRSSLGRAKEDPLVHARRGAVGALPAILDNPGAKEGTPAQRLEYAVRRIIEAELRYLPEVSLLLRVRGNSEVERSALEERRRF